MGFSSEGKHLYAVSGQEEFVIFDIETKLPLKSVTGPLGRST